MQLVLMTLSATKTESWNATAAYPATNEDGDDDYGDKNWRPSTKKRTQNVKIIYIYIHVLLDFTIT